MTISEKFFLIKKACDQLKVCQILVRNEPVSRVVLPIGICLTHKRGMIIVCKQIDAEQKGKSKPRPCNIPMEDCVSIKILEKKFEVVPAADMDPSFCSDWLVHV